MYQLKNINYNDYRVITFTNGLTIIGFCICEDDNTIFLNNCVNLNENKMFNSYSIGIDSFNKKYIVSQCIPSVDVISSYIHETFKDTTSPINEQTEIFPVTQFSYITDTPQPTHH